MTATTTPAPAPLTVWALWAFPASGEICEQEHVHVGRTHARAMALTAERIERWFGSEATIVALLVSPTDEAKREAERAALALRP